ncbi:MAG: AAA family ATPase [Acidobacteriota bacterium]
MPLTPLTFRLFVSSTFTDLREERNALHRTVFPALRKLCEDHGARFQAIDLRWGVRDEAALDQQTMRICLDEIRRCQDVTPRPNFLVLLGDRYGWRPLPPEIPADEWHLIVQHFRDQGETGERRLRMLEAWYSLDENARAGGNPPGACVLASRASDERGTDRYEDGQVWESEVERPLRAILEDAVTALRFDEWRRLKYGGSATAQEIARGALGVRDAAEHVFCFFRTINGLPRDATAEGYRDLTRHPATGATAERLTGDDESDALLSQLKTTLITALPPEHVFSCTAEWRQLPPTLSAAEWAALHAHLSEQRTLSEARADRRAVARLDNLRATVEASYDRVDEASFRLSPRVQSMDADSRLAVEGQLRRAVFHEGQPPITITHLDGLCRDVERALSAVIVREIEAARTAREQSQTTEVDEEIAAHDQFARERLRSKRAPERSIFVGRVAALQRIADYVNGTDPRPLALSGEPGSGKSALMAQAAEQTRRLHPGAVVVSRFIGWTPGSSVVRELLDKLCRQIARAYGSEEATPSDYRELVQEVPKRLASATTGKPLMIFLDGLDQLSDADYARNLIWLPVDLPPNVRLIVSSSTEPGDTDAVLKRRLPEECRFSLDDMLVDEADQLLRHWLDDVERTLKGRAPTAADSTGQWRLVLEAFRGCRRPLYLKLAFEEARRWRSFDDLSRTPLAANVLQLVQQLFDRLARRTHHGEALVAASLGSLTAARHGLTEDEMIQLLSRDPAVLAEIRKYHRPPEEQLPVVIWSRLYFDLRPYLTERRADETSLFAFFHRQLDQVARDRYLNPVKASRHRALAEYFGEQALVMGEARTPNIRKLSELPYQQTSAGDMWDQLYATLTDFDFLEAKCTHVAVTTEGSGPDARKVYGGVYELQEDYRRALDQMPAE